MDDTRKAKLQFPAFTSTHLAMLACVALTLLAALVAPGSVSFGADESALVGKALLANRAEVAATSGLTGTFGIAYGPVPTWIYQQLLGLTHDPVTLVSLRASAFLLVLGAALLSLGRTLGLSPWIAPAVIALPWVWWHSRQPWDNSFLIPFAALAFAGLARFAKNGSPIGLLTTILACGAMLSTHLMSVPVVGAIALFLLVTCRKSLLEHLPTALCATAIVLGTHWMYLSRFIRGAAKSTLSAQNVAPAATAESAGLLQSLVFPFSGELLSGASPVLGVPSAAWIGSVAILAGAVLSVRSLIASRRAIQPDAHEAFHDAPAKLRGAVLREIEQQQRAGAIDLRAALPMVCVASLVLTGVFFAVARPGLHGHYLHAVLVPAFVLAAMAWQAIPSSVVRTSLGTAYLLAMLVITATLATRSIGATTIGLETPTLATLDAIAADLHQSNTRTARTTEPFLQRHPGVLRTLIALKSESEDHAPTVAAQSHPGRVLRFKPDASDDRAVRPIDLTGPIDLPQYDARSLATVGE